MQFATKRVNPVFQDDSSGDEESEEDSKDSFEELE